MRALTRDALLIRCPSCDGRTYLIFWDVDGYRFVCDRCKTRLVLRKEID